MSEARTKHNYCGCGFHHEQKEVTCTAQASPNKHVMYPLLPVFPGKPPCFILQKYIYKLSSEIPK